MLAVDGEDHVLGPLKMDSMGDGAAAETKEYGLGNPMENVNVPGFEIRKKESYRKWS